MAGKWVKKAHDAARLPLGVVDDPRRLNSFSLMTMCKPRASSPVCWPRVRSSVRPRESSRKLSKISRRSWIVTSGQEPFPTIYSLVGLALERTAVTGLERWLQAVGPNVELLKKAQAMMEFHQANMPDSLIPIGPSTLLFPHERDRYLKCCGIAGTTAFRPTFWSSLASSLGKGTQKKIGQRPFSRSDATSQDALLGGPCPATRVDSKARGINMHSMSVFTGPSMCFLLPPAGVFPPVSVRGGLLITALARYQAEQGKAAKKLGRSGAALSARAAY